MTNTSGDLTSIGSVLYALVVVASILEVGLILVFFSHEGTFNIELSQLLENKEHLNKNQANKQENSKFWTECASSSYSNGTLHLWNSNVLALHW